MKFSIFFLAFFLHTFNSIAQKDKSATPMMVDMAEVVVKNTPPEKLNNKVKTDDVFYELSPDEKARDYYSRTFFLTKFPGIESDSIYLYSAELKLKTFDTSLFDIRLMILQIQPNDTFYRIIKIDASKIVKNKMVLDLFVENITLKPGEFYMGYGIRLKNITSLYRYRMFSTNKGIGALLTFDGNSFSLVSNEHFPNIFPFKLSYKKY